MHSISNDARHSDVEMLTRRRTKTRTFAGCAMKLALTKGVSGPWAQEVIRPSPQMVDALRSSPEAAAAIIPRFSPRKDGSDGLRTAAILEEVVRTQVIPELAFRHCVGEPLVRPRSCEERASDLADLLLTADVDAVLALVRSGTAQLDQPTSTRSPPSDKRSSSQT